MVAVAVGISINSVILMRNATETRTGHGRGRIWHDYRQHNIHAQRNRDQDWSRSESQVALLSAA